MTARRTRYQATHRPTRVTDELCPAADTWEPYGKTHRCTTCRRVLARKVRHLPDRRGTFGWVERYADGSTFHVTPGAEPKAA